MATQTDIIERAAGHYQVCGDLDFTTAVALKQQGEALLERGPASNTFDMERVQQCGSVGISLLLCWLRKARALGKEVRFLNVPKELYSIIEVSDLDEVLPLVLDTEFSAAPADPSLTP